jgi:hypothetical protein
MAFSSLVVRMCDAMSTNRSYLWGRLSHITSHKWLCQLDGSALAKCSTADTSILPQRERPRQGLFSDLSASLPVITLPALYKDCYPCKHKGKGTPDLTPALPPR